MSRCEIFWNSLEDSIEYKRSGDAMEENLLVWFEEHEEHPKTVC